MNWPIISSLNNRLTNYSIHQFIKKVPIILKKQIVVHMIQLFAFF